MCGNCVRSNSGNNTIFGTDYSLRRKWAAKEFLEPMMMRKCDSHAENKDELYVIISDTRLENKIAFEGDELHDNSSTLRVL